MAGSLLQGKRFFCREWAFAKLSHCLEQRSLGKVCGALLVGGAGCGKTALCCELVWPTGGPGAVGGGGGGGRQRSLHRRLLAYHFCQAQDASTLSPADFIHQIVQQVCSSDLLQGYADKLRDPEVTAALDYRRCQADPDDAFKKALLFPLLELDPPKHPCFLLVDSVDESYLQTHQAPAQGPLLGPPLGAPSRTIAELLAGHHHLLPHWLLLVCSARRQSRAVARLFTGFRKVNLDDLRKPQVIRDVQQYILARLDQEEALRQHISRETAEMLNQLHIKSNGCFLYLEKVLDGVADGFIMLREVRDIPGTLNGLYLWLCQRLFNRKQFHKVQPLLHALLAARRPISEEQLRVAVWTRHTAMSKEDFGRRLHLLRRVLVTGNDGARTLFHPSFSEWLLDVKHCTQKYLCRVSEGHAMLALAMSARASELGPEEVHELALHLTRLPPAPNGATWDPCVHLPLWMALVGAPTKDSLVQSAPTDPAALRLLIETGAEYGAEPDEDSQLEETEPELSAAPPVPTIADAPEHAGQTALNLAARQGHASLVATLLASGANPDQADSDGWTPLRSAAWGGHTEVVAVLLGAGATVDLEDADGRTALRAAAWGGHEEIVGALVRAGAQVNRADREGRTALIAAAYMGHAEIVEALLESGAEVDHSDADGRTALSVAALCLPASEGHAKVVTILLEKGAHVDHQDREGMTPLLVAAFEGHKEVCELLLEYEADADHADLSQRTPLWAAASMGHASVVELLLFWGCYVDSIDAEGRTVLSVAAAQGSPQVVRQLLDRGLDEMHRDNAGWTPLHYAAFEGHREVCEALVEAGGRVDEADNEGKTALVLAAQEGHGAVVATLLQLGADIESRSHDGKSALRAAALQGHKDVAHLLLCRGASMDYRDADGRSTLYLLSLENRTAMARFLLHSGSSAESRDLEGRTPLHVSAWQGHQEMVALLLESGAQVDATDNENRTALHSASWQGHAGVVRLLLERGASVDHPCNQGATALCIAAQEGHAECVRVLLRFGADPTRSDRCGRNAMRVAVKSGHEAVVRMLEEHSCRPTMLPLVTPFQQNSGTSSASGSTGETKPSSAVLCCHLEDATTDVPTVSAAAPQSAAPTATSPESTLADAEKRRSILSIGNTSSGQSSSNLTSSTKSSQHSQHHHHHHQRQHHPLPQQPQQPQQPLAPLAFTQQVQACSRAKHRPLSRVLSPLSEPQSPIYASPPQSPLSDALSSRLSPGAAPGFNNDLMRARMSQATAINCPFSLEGEGGLAPLAFTQDSHMKIILGTRSPPDPGAAQGQKVRRNGIVTNPNLKSGQGGQQRGGSAHHQRANGFPWKKETPL